MNRELRRFYARKAKVYIIKYTEYSRWVDVEDKRRIGIFSKTPAHCSKANCCGNPRRYQKDRLTRQELKQLDSFKDWLEYGIERET